MIASPARFLAGAALAVLVPAAALAADQPAAPDPHDHTPTDIVVTGSLGQSRQDILSGVAVLQGAQLTQAVRASIGDTLLRTPGASATSFGPTASRPMLRGLQGERVRVLSDGIGSIDVSNTSADHASVVNPLLAERIEVLRGPQSLLYGSSAIGGVVNVIDRRIPTRVPTEPVHVGASATYGSAAGERALAGTVEVPIAGGLVLHADGSYDKTRDLSIGGPALSPALRAEALATAASGLGDPDIDYRANAALAGRLPNTAARTVTGGLGLSWIGSGGMIGAAYTHTDSLYGVPVRFAVAPGEEQEAPRLKLRQDRIDARAAVNVGSSLIDKLMFRFGYADYAHSELEPDGAIGTTFLNQGLEARLELTHAPRGGWKGATGVQFSSRDFDVIGEEVFLPKNGTRQLGVFSVQQLDLGAVRLEAGARYEHSVLTAQPTPAQSQFFGGERRFDLLSGSLGGSAAIAPGWRLGLNLSRTSRAPSAEELFPNGPHAGTEAFEIGDPALRPERASSAEAVLRGIGNGYSFEASAYYTRFANFIFDARTGAMEEGLPVYAYSQADASWYGFEVQGKVALARIGGWTVEADALADMVRARIDGFGPAPRIPPLRVLGGIGVTSAKLDLRAEVERVTAQNRVAPNETPTPGFTLVNAELNWRPWGLDRPLSFALSANNLLDVAARRHASILKDYAPLSGRDFRISARLEL